MQEDRHRQAERLQEEEVVADLVLAPTASERPFKRPVQAKRQGSSWSVRLWLRIHGFALLPCSSVGPRREHPCMRYVSGENRKREREREREREQHQHQHLKTVEGKETWVHQSLRHVWCASPRHFSTAASAQRRHCLRKQANKADPSVMAWPRLAETSFLLS